MNSGLEDGRHIRETLEVLIDHQVPTGQIPLPRIVRRERISKRRDSVRGMEYPSGQSRG